MTEARVATNRRTQRLEQVEASATQLETMVSRERDELYDQLMQALQNNPAGAQPPSAPAVPQTPAPCAGTTAPIPQAYATPAPSQGQQPTQPAPAPMQQQGGVNPFHGGPQGSPANPPEPPRQPAPGTAQSISPMTGLGYGFITTNSIADTRTVVARNAVATFQHCYPTTSTGIGIGIGNSRRSYPHRPIGRG
eukprot:133793-Amphidinium_carterae.1